MIAKKLYIRLAVAVALAWPLLAHADEGRPVVAGDLSGKKICWNNGSDGAYAADGNYFSGQGHRSHWSVPSPGVVKIGYRYRQIVVLPDGRFERYWFVGRSNRPEGRDRYRWGTVCA
jgi:hypothetical protein